jgi:serine/threonine protein kinase
MIEVLSGLHSAHAMNVVHRDLKPQNIFLTSRVGCDPLAKLLDFGLSKMTPAVTPGDAAEQTSLTAIGSRVGTPYYMAPEQFSGSDVDARADIFACGVVLYETLTGKKPFPGPSGEELVSQIRAASPRRATSLRADLPPELDRVIASALAHNLGARYPRAIAFQDDLRALHAMIASRPAKPSSAANLAAIPSLADSDDSSADASVDVAFGEDTVVGDAAELARLAELAQLADIHDLDDIDELTTHRAVEKVREGAPPKIDSDDAEHANTRVRTGRAPR